MINCSSCKFYDKDNSFKYPAGEEMSECLNEESKFKFVYGESKLNCKFYEHKNVKNFGSSSLEKFKEFEGYSAESPLERLRFFCSLAMSSEDWIASESFFNELERELDNK